MILKNTQYITEGCSVILCTSDDALVVWNILSIVKHISHYYSIPFTIMFLF